VCVCVCVSVWVCVFLPHVTDVVLHVPAGRSRFGRFEDGDARHGR